MNRKVSAALYAGPLLGLLLLPVTATALSLGEAQLQSRYGQPLQLRVPVDLDSEDEQADAGLIQARLLGLDYYESQGVAPPELSAAEFSIRTESEQGRIWAVITTSRPLREPMLTLFVSVRLGPSRIIREVPVLLDFQPPAAARPVPPVVAATEPPEAPSVPVAGVIPATVAVDATVATGVEEPAAVAPPPRKRRRVRPAADPLADAAAVPAPASGLRLDISLRRPEGYSRFRLDESFGSFRQALPAPAAAEAPEALSAPATEVAGPVASTPVASPAAEPAGSPASEETGGSWWSYAWLLLLAAAFVYALRRQRAGRLPYLNIANLPGRYSDRFGEREKPVQVAASLAPASPPPASPEAASLPLEAPTELRPEQPAAPVEALMLMTDSPVAESPLPSREGYPNQDLRDRVAQLARQMNTASEKRKLELVKAYIDVERVDSARKLLSELEDRHYGESRPERLDFELV